MPTVRPLHQGPVSVAEYLCNGGPGTPPDCSDSCCAAFLLDPDGHQVEAVCDV